MNTEASLPPPKTKPERIHLPQLDVLRAVAILLVVCFHSLVVFRADHLPWRGAFRDYQSETATALLPFYPATFGSVGVSIFFVLSGFVIHLSVLQSGKLDVVHFYSRRFWRIYPAYLVALIAFSLLRPPTWGNLLTHLFMVHNVSSRTFFGINDSFWSLAVEIQFYLLYPFLFWLRGKVGMSRAFWFSVLISLLIRGMLLTTDSGRAVFTGDKFLMNGAITPILWMDWVLGAWVAECFLQQQKLFPRWAFWVAITIAVASTQIRVLNSFSFSLFSIASAALIEQLIYKTPNSSPLPTERALVTMGVWSYSLYLWHQPLMLTVEREIGRRIFGTNPAVLYFVVLFGTLIIATVIAYLSYRFVEKPGILLGNHVWNWFHRSRSRTENGS